MVNGGLNTGNVKRLLSPLPIDPKFKTEFFIVVRKLNTPDTVPMRLDPDSG